MKIETLSITDLIPYAANTRTHSDEQVAQIAASIKEFGFCNPVLVDDGNGIIAGHGRVLAAGKLGFAEVPCVRLGHLTDAQRRAYIIADNKLALNAGWDEELLKAELERLEEDHVELEVIGFSEAELEELIKEPDFLPGSEDEQGQLDELDPKWVKCPSCDHVFDSRNHEHNP